MQLTGAPCFLSHISPGAHAQVDAASREGAYVHGLFLEGARWDDKAGALDDSRHKELSTRLPVRAVASLKFAPCSMGWLKMFLC